MSYRTTNLPSSLRQPSMSAMGSASTSSQSSALQQRISEKRAELENLKQLRDLSAGLAGQMEQLEEKLSTLTNGTEAVATVLSNWNTVLRAIHLASAHLPGQDSRTNGEANGSVDGPKIVLPQTLVRIPVQDTRTEPSRMDDVETT